VCAVRWLLAAGVLGDRWTLLILRKATAGMTRFDDFRSGLGIAVDAGLMTKVPYRGSQNAWLRPQRPAP
jgi:hypothetical protein